MPLVRIWTRVFLILCENKQRLLRLFQSNVTSFLDKMSKANRLALAESLYLSYLSSYIRIHAHAPGSILTSGSGHSTFYLIVACPQWVVKLFFWTYSGSEEQGESIGTSHLSVPSILTGSSAYAGQLWCDLTFFFKRVFIDGYLLDGLECT